MVERIELGEDSYDVIIEKGIINRLNCCIDTERKVLIVTDTGVPCSYTETVLKQFPHGSVYVLPQGESSKSIDKYSNLCETLLKKNFSRKDCIISVGGGVVSDIAGFVAATYMRGIDVYYIPTTLLSQVDASIGGKTGIDFCGNKNVLGAFKQPKAVFIDTDTLRSLPQKQISNGFAEIIKMALTLDRDLFERLENGIDRDEFDEIVLRCVRLKKNIVEKDVSEQGIRRVLNFGHTIGHIIESNSDHLHGECVAMGMLAMCTAQVRGKLRNLLQKFGLPLCVEAESEAIIKAFLHDKKSNGNTVIDIFVENIGSYKEVSIDAEECINMIKEAAK